MLSISAKMGKGNPFGKKRFSGQWVCDGGLTNWVFRQLVKQAGKISRPNWCRLKSKIHASKLLGFSELYSAPMGFVQTVFFVERVEKG